MNSKPMVLSLLLVFGCTTQQRAAGPDAPAAQSAAPAATQSEFRNLQILPRDIPREQLVATMRSFSRGLGVRCNHCHVVTATTPEEQLDFPSDAKEEKRVARVMLQMAMQINDGWMERVEAAEGHHEEAEVTHGGEPAALKVSCWTCHRGHPEPEKMPPPPPSKQ